MLYFNSFPKIASPDYKNNFILSTNLMARTNMIPSLAKNPLLFYSYDIQEGDTPEIVASKYYGDVNRHWMVLYANQIIDPQWQWPLTSNQMTAFLNDKYKQEALNANVPSVISYTQQTVKYHYKQITVINSQSSVRKTNTIIIDKEEYDSTISGTTVQTFTNGQTVSRTITVRADSIYDWEINFNESKRKIYLINNIYAPQIESQFKELMSR